MLLSRTSEYGIQALVHMRAQEGVGFMSIGRIATDLSLSPSFLAKVINRLVERGLLRSRKGVGGGVCLAKPANEIQLLEVVEAMEGGELFTRCVSGYPECGDHVPCPLHVYWGPIRERITAMLSENSLDDLVRRKKIK
jgi:Rrf2 family protein